MYSGIVTCSPGLKQGLGKFLNVLIMELQKPLSFKLASLGATADQGCLMKG